MSNENTKPQETPQNGEEIDDETKMIARWIREARENGFAVVFMPGGHISVYPTFLTPKKQKDTDTKE